MSHVTHMNESCHTHVNDMARTICRQIKFNQSDLSTSHARSTSRVTHEPCDSMVSCVTVLVCVCVCVCVCVRVAVIVCVTLSRTRFFCACNRVSEALGPMTLCVQQCVLQCATQCCSMWQRGSECIRYSVTLVTP